MRTLTTLLLLTAATLGETPFDAVRGDLPHETEAGAFTGSLAWGSARAEARLESLGGTWTLALRPPARRLIDFARGLENSPLAGLDISDPVVVFAPDAVSVDLGPEAARFYGVERIRLQRGINLLARVNPRRDSAVRKLLADRGVSIDGLLLEGVILRDFDADALRQARADGKLKEALRKGTMLTVRVPNLSLRGLPESYAARDCHFYVTGEPGFGLGFTLSTGTRTFAADLGMRRAANGTTEAILTARHEGRWNDAFDIRGFQIEGGTLLIAMDAAQNASIGLRTTMVLGSKRVAIAGKLTVHAVTGVATNLIVAGSIDSIGSTDLIAIANALAPSKRRHDAAALPPFSLRDVAFRFAPLGGDERLGIAAGIALKGTLFALDRNLGSVDGAIDQTTAPATVRLHGTVASFEAGPLALRDAAVAIHMGATANPYFRIRGASRMWITSKAIDVDCSRDRMEWAVADRVGGVYAARYRFASRDGGRAWAGEVRFDNELSRTLERDVARAALAWAGRVERDFGKAKADLDRATAGVQGIDRQIAAARAQVQRERAKATADLRRAEAEVERLDGLIRQRRKEIYDHQMALYNQVRWHQANVKKKHAAWQKAIEATRRAKVWEKPKYKAREAQAWADYHAAGTARDAKRVEYDLARKQVDGRLQALQAGRGTAAGTLQATQAVYRRVTGNVSVDADPRVATLLVRRDAAVAALTAARAAVQGTGDAMAGAGRLTSWAARNHGQVLMVDEARLAGGLGGSLRATGGRMHLKVRFLGKSYALSIGTDLDRIRRGLHGIVWNELRRQAGIQARTG